MPQSSVGYSTGGLLGGLRQRGDVGAFAKGQAMQSAAGLGMKAQQQNQELGLKEMQQQNQMQQAGNRQAAEQASNRLQENLAEGALGSRQRNFMVGNAYDYAGLRKRRALQWQQALLNNASQEM
jgi:hypothetical protein